VNISIGITLIQIAIEFTTINKIKTMSIEVAEPSDSFVALCAFVTEEDLHYLRRLGRSCARCVDLYWARDGKVRHRALVRDIARVRSLVDQVRFTVPTMPQATGMLAFIEIMDAAQESGYMPPRSLVLLARRTVQDDRWALLYLIVYAIVTDNSTLIDKLFQIAEEGGIDASKLTQKPDILDGFTVIAPNKGGGVDDDGDVDRALNNAADFYNKLKESEVDFTSLVDEINDDEYEHPFLADGRDGNISDLFYDWWRELRVVGSQIMQPYFYHLYPTRCDIRFEGGADDVAQMTLADHLLFFAAAWHSSSVAQYLMSVPEIRRNLRVSVFFAVCEKLTNTLSKAARSLSSNDDLGKLLTPIGIARLKNAFNNPCSSVEEHFKHLGSDAAFVDAVSIYADPAMRDTLKERHFDLFRQFLISEKTTESKTDTDEPAAPAADFNVSLQTEELIDPNVVFWFACRTNNVELARQMLSPTYKVDPAANNNFGVRIAAKFNAHSVLKHLFVTCPQVDPAAQQNFALCAAVDAGAKESIIELLRTQRVDPAANNDYPLCRASERGDVFGVSLLMSYKKVDPNARGGASLLNAVRNVSVPMIRDLLIEDTHKRLTRSKYVPLALEQARTQLATLTDEANANSKLHEIIELLQMEQPSS
jgi:hypothetical protein